MKTRFKVGYNIGGGGYLLTHVVPYKGTIHKVEYHLNIAKYLGCEINKDVEWGIYLTGDEKKRVKEILEGEGVSPDRPMVAMHPGSRKELKCWSPEGYAKVADYIISEVGATILLTGAHEEVPLVETVKGFMKNRPVVLAGKTTLRELTGIISRCSLFICNDSSPMHIAAAMKTPTVAIFGPSKSVETAPYGKGHIVVEKDFPCRYACDEDICHFRSHNQCMKEISMNDVFMAVAEMLKSEDGGKGNFYGKKDITTKTI